MDEPKTLLPLTASQLEELEEAVSRYEGQLTVDAARYLLARGLDREVVSTSRLGVVADSLPEHRKFTGMLAIPYLDKDGQPLTLRFRCLEEHDHRAHFHGKYNSLAEDPPRMFNIRSLWQAKDTIHVAEGEFDALILSKVGLPAVAIPGAHLFQWRHQKMLAGYSRIYVWGDPDEAGAEFSKKLTKRMTRAKSVRLKVGDVTETYLDGGAEALYALIGEEK